MLEPSALRAAPKTRHADRVRITASCMWAHDDVYDAMHAGCCVGAERRAHTRAALPAALWWSALLLRRCTAAPHLFRACRCTQPDCGQR